VKWGERHTQKHEGTAWVSQAYMFLSSAEVG